MKAQEKSIIIIAGATASGKSALALRLAKLSGGIIINGDSEQVYADLSILTARPSKKDMKDVPHYLYGFLSGDKVCSAGLWTELAIAKIRQAQREGCQAIIVGGTGMYLKSLIDGIAKIPDIPRLIRERTENIFKDKGLAYLYKDLIQKDSEARKLNQNDKQRILRAYNVYESTGKSIFKWQAETASPLKDSTIYKVLVNFPRAVIYKNCEQRLEKMINEGCIDEVAKLAGKGYAENCPINKALGVKAFSSYLKGDLSLKEAKEITCRDTKRYVKRQLTWFRNQYQADLVVDNEQKADSLCCKMER